jgi:transposase
MRPYGSQKSIERRRRRAITLLAQGTSPHEVARRSQAFIGSVYRWRLAWTTGGEAALAAKPTPGAPRKLTDQPREHILQLLLQTAAVATRGQGQWLSQRAMDLEAHRRGDSGGVWHPLSPCPCLEELTPSGLELSGAGAAAHPTPRPSHCSLAALPVAGDKKKPNDLGPISPSWMRAACCSSPRAGAPGRLRDRRRACATTTSMTATRPCLPSRCPRNVSPWGCISAGSPHSFKAVDVAEFLRALLWHCGICEDRSCSSGTVAAFIRDPPSTWCARGIPGCIWRSSQPMLRSLILPSRSRTTSKATSPTACCGTYATSTLACEPIPAASGARKPNDVLSSVPLSCLLHRGSSIIT